MKRRAAKSLSSVLAIVPLMPAKGRALEWTAAPSSATALTGHAAVLPIIQTWDPIRSPVSPRKHS